MADSVSDSSAEPQYEIVDYNQATSDNAVLEFVVIPLALLIIAGLAVFFWHKRSQKQSTEPEYQEGSTAENMDNTDEKTPLEQVEAANPDASNQA